MRTLADWVRDAVRAAGWAPITVFLAHVVMARVFGWYGPVPWLDIPMHFTGGVAIAHFFERSLLVPAGVRALGKLTPTGRGVLAFALVATSTVVWEFAEWTTDRLGLSRAQGGLPDTMGDMALGLAGGVAYLLIARLVTTPR